MSNVKSLYIRNEWKKRDISIVSDLNVEGDEAVIRCGWSFRSNHEKQFVKKEGRRIAMERMDSSDPGYSAIFTISKEDVSFFKISSEILSIILQKETTPKKYLNDIEEDLHFFIYCSNSPVPNWNSFFEL